jgi:CheY-like chemotaxis protein
MNRDLDVGQNSVSVLIVDDNPKNLQIVGNILQDEGFDVEFATDGDSTIEWVNNKDFDLILLDVMMPGTDGFQVCRKIKVSPKCMSVPVIFLTASTDNSMIIKGFDAGGVDYITKPFNKRELVARVKTHSMLKISHDDNERYLDEITLKNKLLTYSVQYAQKIQEAILPPIELMNKVLDDCFILYLPKDIVSGDFYWLKEIRNDAVLLAVADCTGHGVPGAVMSMLSYTGLNQAVDEYNLTGPAEILSHVHQYLKSMLHKTTLNSPVIDGMDISLCKLDAKRKKLECCNTNNPVYLARKGELTVLKGEFVTIGDVDVDTIKLSTHKISLSKGDTLYLFTDGYKDQFGGRDDKKFSSRRLAELLRSVSSRACTEQLSILESRFREWKEDEDQVDDVTILGFCVR